MKKLLFFGFLIGFGVCFYTLPTIESRFGKLPRPSFGLFSSDDNNIHSSTTINPDPPEKKGIATQDAAQFMAALTATMSAPPNNEASEDVIAAISRLITIEPQISTYVHNRLEDGLTNKEATDIFNRYSSLN